GGLGRPPAPAPAADTTTPPPAPPVGTPDTTLAASPTAVGPHFVIPPQVGDGRLWVLPRPALPGEVADALYGQEEHKDSIAAHRDAANVPEVRARAAGAQAGGAGRGETGEGGYDDDEGGYRQSGALTRPLAVPAVSEFGTHGQPATRRTSRCSYPPATPGPAG